MEITRLFFFFLTSAATYFPKCRHQDLLQVEIPRCGHTNTHTHKVKVLLEQMYAYGEQAMSSGVRRQKWMGYLPRRTLIDPAGEDTRDNTSYYTRSQCVAQSLNEANYECRDLECT